MKVADKPSLFLAVILTIASTVCGLRGADHLATPNLVVVLCDDLGYGDLGCYGHPDIKTPRIDEFAGQSLRFNHCYSAAPNCSPSRTGLMTGRTPWRVGIHNWIPFLSPMHVPESEITIATLLKNAGYETCLSGKWHLNGHFNLPAQPQPDDHGFSHWFATQNNALPNHENPYNFVRNDIPVGPQTGYAAELVAAEAINWLEHIRDPDRPFFQFISFHEPHEPIATHPQFESQYKKFDDPAKRAHHGNITQMDAAFGKWLDALDRLDLSDNTLVFFTSDNGPAITGMHPHGSAGVLRDKKGAIYEGGIRVPGLLRWPGKIAGPAEVNEPVSGVDLLPTFCELAGIQIPDDRAIDGTSFAPLLRGEKNLTRATPLYWQFNRAKSEVKVAIRSGPWKLAARQTGPKFARGADLTDAEQQAHKSAELTGFELYHLIDDPAEQHNRVESRSDIFAELLPQLKGKYREVRDQSPIWPEWQWPRYESQRIEWPEYWLNRNKASR